ncbi:MAG: inorganic phosphate transporter [Parcubacteria group bacterium]
MEGLLVVLLLVLGAEFVNGWTDAPNAIATVVSTRVLAPRHAVLLATVFNIIGTLFGTAVAATIGKGIVVLSAINLETIAAALIGIIVWSSINAKWGIPTSESHALVAGLAGATLATAGPEALLWIGWKKVLIGLALSSVGGFVASLLIARFIVAKFASSLPTKTCTWFSRLQIISAGFMAFNHGSNDGQKFIGVFTMALVLGGVYAEFTVPLWVVFLCAGTMGVGTMVGGWKIIKKVGMSMVDLKPWQGFCAETAAGTTIMAASHFGIPLSTTHTITMSIAGVGASRRLDGVRWDIAKDIVWAWVLTFPVCGAIGFITALLIKQF